MIRRQRSLLRLAPLGSVMWLVAVGACSPQPLTQIVVAIDSDWDGFDRVSVQVEGFAKTANLEAKLADKPLPRRFVLVHDGGPLGPLSLTVRGFVKGSDEPVISQPRTRIYFQSDKTLALRVDLLFGCLQQDCGTMACVAAGRCVSSSSASRLTAFSGSIKPIDIVYHVKAGDVLDAASSGDAAVEPQLEAGTLDGAALAEAAVPTPHDGSAPDTDAGLIESKALFTFMPSNFDPAASAISTLPRPHVVLNCGPSEFDSTSMTFSNWCGPEPSALAVQQAGGAPAVLLVMSTFQLASGSSLQLIGSKPVILAIFGDAHIAGIVDASAHDATSGVGAESACGSGKGSSGTSSANGSGAGSGGGSAGGGSGGGFGGPGGAGGTSEQTGTTVGGGIANGNASLIPLRGGCAGGRGGVTGFAVVASAGGGGGGAVQISSAGKLIVSGTITAGGGGGGAGTVQQIGGGGGGSGGAILIEAELVDLQTSAVIAANGGGGGAGQTRSFAGLSATGGQDGVAGEAAAAGGTNSAGVGPGGAGGALQGEALAGSDGSMTSGGGGGGGGYGRIRIQPVETCTLPGIVSPPPSVVCSSCGVCAVAPALGCHALSFEARPYYRCDSPLAFQSARARCQIAGMDLVEIDTSAENDWLHSQVPQEAWIGASDAAQEGTWLWLHSGKQFWMGSDRGGVAVGGAFTAWASAEPNNLAVTANNADCGTMDADGLWHDRACDIGYAYVCE